MVDVEKLIEEVRKFPVLYDQTSEKYRNSEHKENIWENISTTLEAKGKSKINVVVIHRSFKGFQYI